jgi:hypothetical protein
MDDWNTQMVFNSIKLRGENKTKQALRESGFPENEIPRILSMSIGPPLSLFLFCFYFLFNVWIGYAMQRSRARSMEREQKNDLKARKALMKMQRAMLLGMSGGGMDREKEKEREKPQPVFSGHGHRLVDTAKPVASAPKPSNGSPSAPEDAAAAALSSFKYHSFFDFVIYSRFSNWRMIRLEFDAGAPKTVIRVRSPTGVINVEINLTHTVRQLYNHLRTYFYLFALVLSQFPNGVLGFRAC